MKTYINITIDYFSSPKIKPVVYYYRNDGVNPLIFTCDKLTATEANIMMWKLVKLGGENNYRTNKYNNAMSTREVSFYGQL